MNKRNRIMDIFEISVVFGCTSDSIIRLIFHMIPDPAATAFAIVGWIILFKFNTVFKEFIGNNKK